MKASEILQDMIVRAELRGNMLVRHPSGIWLEIPISFKDKSSAERRLEADKVLSRQQKRRPRRTATEQVQSNAQLAMGIGSMLVGLIAGLTSAGRRRRH